MSSRIFFAVVGSHSVVLCPRTLSQWGQVRPGKHARFMNQGLRLSRVRCDVGPGVADRPIHGNVVALPSAGIRRSPPHDACGFPTGDGWRAPSGYPKSLISFAGTPPTIVCGLTSLATTAPAATTAPSPIVTPGSIVTLAPIQHPSATTTGLTVGFPVRYPGPPTSCVCVRNITC